MRPNVFLIVFDAARRDAFEPYGAAAGSTPAVAQLASRGVARPDVYATAPWTVPSHASMFTGLMPRAAGLAKAGSPPAMKELVLAHEDRLLQSVLRRAGYRTGAASANLWLSTFSGFDVGFDDFAQVDTGRHGRLHEPGARERARWLAEAVRGRADDGARAVERTLEGWLSESPRPFFWFVNLLECHSPYLPPRPYGHVSRLDRLRAADEARRYYTLNGIWTVCGGGMQVPDDALERARRLYAGAVRYMDDWLARMLERLDRAGVLDETLVIVTSDHGENFGEGGLLAHGLSLDNRLINVPFVAAGPGSGRELSSLAEVPRMVAEAAGVEDHPWREELPVGFGVAQSDPLADPTDETAMQALADMGVADALETFTTPLSCAVRDGLKLLRRGEREEVYDLAADPLEVDPVAPETVAAAGRDSELAALRSALDHPAVTSRRGVHEPAPADVPGPSEEEMQELEERMKLLGYM
ncbi:MAG: sulfatase-like hydrolase/transferase [Thermoleophilaceae bacterium]